MFRRSCFEHGEINQKVLAYKAIHISYDLYGIDVTSAHELAKGYTRSVYEILLYSLPESVRKDHDELVAVWKLNKILRTKATIKKNLIIGDLVQVYCKRAREKYGKWSDSQPVAAVNCEARMVSVPGSIGKNLKAAYKHIRHVIQSVSEVALLVKICDKYL